MQLCQSEQRVVMETKRRYMHVHTYAIYSARAEQKGRERLKFQSPQINMMDRSNEWAALSCRILSGSSHSQPASLRISIRNVSRHRPDAWMSEALQLRSELEAWAQQLQYSDRARAYARCCAALFFIQEEQVTEHDVALFEVDVTRFIAAATGRMESLQRSLLASRQHDDNQMAHRTGVLACLAHALQVQLVQPLAMLQKMRHRPSLKHTLNPTAIPQHSFTPSLQFTKTQNHRFNADPMHPDHDQEPEKDDDVSIFAANHEYDAYLDSIWEFGIQSWFQSSRNMSTNSQGPHSQWRDFPVTTIHPPSPRTYTAIEDDVQQEAQHIRMQQAQLISHQVRTQTQHPLEQQMMEITALLSQFTQILTQQQDDVLYIHDSAKLSLDHLKAGKEQIQEAAQHKRKRNHALRHLFAWIIFTLACTLLFFHWILP